MSSASVASRPNPVTNSSFHKDSGGKHGPDFNSADNQNQNAKSQSRSQVQAPAKDDDLSTKSKTANGPSEAETHSQQPQLSDHPSQSTSEPKESPSQNTQHDSAATHKSSSSPSKSADAEQKDGQHDENADGDAPAGDDEYPEQRHAGHLDGVGPEYGKMHGVTMSDRFLGVKEHIKGAFKRDPELKQKAHERMTGELKKKEQQDDSNPFETAGDDGKDKDKAEESPKDDESAAKRRADDEVKSKPKSSEGIDEGKQEEQGTTSVPHAHPTEKGREEQAASVRPEGEGHTNLEQKGQDKVAAGEPN